MGFYRGPNIVTDGLVLALDAASEKSFRGEPTTNLIITNPIPTSTSGFSFAGPSSFTMSYNATEQAMEFEADNSAVWGFYVTNNSLNSTPLDTGSLYSTSFEWKVGSRNTYTGSLRHEIIRGGGTSSSLSTVFSTNISSQTGNYSKFTHTFTPSHPGVDGDRQFRLIGSSFNSGSFRVHILWKKLQLEKLNRSTPFVSGSRGATVSTGGGLIDLSRNNFSASFESGSGTYPIYSNSNNGVFTFNGNSGSFLISRPVQDDFTLSCWFKTNQLFSTAGNWYSGAGLMDCEVAFTRNDFGLSLAGGKVHFGVGNPDTSVTGSLLYNDNNWHHVTATREKSSGLMTLYVDSTLVGTKTAQTGSLTQATDMRIGAIRTNVNFFSGSISNVQIYNRALSASEILQNYTAQKSRFNLT